MLPRGVGEGQKDAEGTQIDATRLCNSQALLESMVTKRAPTLLSSILPDAPRPDGDKWAAGHDMVGGRL